MSAVLQVSKGTVGITGPDLVVAAERARDDLTNSVTSISTDSLSQATIQIKDLVDSDEGSAQLLAAITLQGNTLVTFIMPIVRALSGARTRRAYNFRS